MRTKFLLVAMFWWLGAYTALQAQITLVLQVPPTGVMLKNQLWNMALVYAGSGSISVTVQLTLLDAKNGQPVMTAQSRPVLLTKGTNAENVRTVGPIAYNYLSSIFNVDRNPNGFLPVGDYKACYVIAQVVHGGNAITQDCVPVEVQPLSPPQLNLPADTATVPTAYPQFSWLPPTPVNLFSNLTYTMAIVAVNSGQSPYEAIQQNIPVYSIGNYRDAVHVYPASNAPLDTATLYAWRVIAMNEGQFIAQSEVWTFKLAKTRPAPLTVPNGNYIPLRASNQPATNPSVLTGGVIGFKYYSFEKDHATTISIYGPNGLMTTLQETIVYGENYLSYPINGSFQQGKLYRIQLTDSHNIIHYASFSINNSNTKN
jgi:hypothetical protein